MRFSASHLWRISGRGVSCAPVLLVLALAVVLSGAPARTQEAEPEHVTASRAWDLAEQGGLVIVDVRTQGEWRQTGVAPGAARISLYSNWAIPNLDFAEEVLAALGGDHDRPVALVCATGGRSSYAAGMLGVDVDAGPDQTLINVVPEEVVGDGVVDCGRGIILLPR